MDIVRIPAREFSVEDKREHVLRYLSRPHGTKKTYCEEFEITVYQLRTWRAQLADGDLGNGRVPRHTGHMAKNDVAEILRLRKEIARLEGELKRSAEENQRTMKVADALGKAIDAMHAHGVISAEDDAS